MELIISNIFGLTRLGYQESWTEYVHVYASLASRSLGLKAFSC